MKKIFLMMAAFVATMTAMAQKATMEAGFDLDTKTISVYVTNDFDVTSFSFKFALPEGAKVAVAYDEDEDDDIQQIFRGADRLKGSKWTFDVRPAANDRTMVTAWGSTLKGNSGVIATIQLEGELKGLVEFSDAQVAGKDADGNATGQMNLPNFSLDIATAIEGIEAAAENENAPMYNLAGQRVSRVQKGIFIQNGKKVLK